MWVFHSEMSQKGLGTCSVCRHLVVYACFQCFHIEARAIQVCCFTNPAEGSGIWSSNNEYGLTFRFFLTPIIKD